MSSSRSQDEVRKALGSIPDLIAFKPADDSRNWKPCDFMVWWQDRRPDYSASSAWIEVKQNDNKTVYTPELRPAQAAAMRQAAEVGLPFLLVVYWRLVGVYTIHSLDGELPPRMTLEAASSRYGVSAHPSTLGIMLRSVLNGDSGL